MLWILQALLALAFLCAGACYILNDNRMAPQPRMSWVTAVGRYRLQIIGPDQIIDEFRPVLTHQRHKWAAACHASDLSMTHFRPELRLRASSSHWPGRGYP